MFTGACGSQRQQSGFTLIEAVFVLALIGVLAGIAIPNYGKWVRQATCRNSARTVMNLLREVKSKAIASNHEHRIVFDSTTMRVRVLRGDRSFGSSNWDTVAYDWVSFPQGISVSFNRDYVHLNPNGTSNAGTVTVRHQDASVKEYRITVASTGRVRNS